MDKAIQTLIEAGYRLAGETDSHTFKVVTSQSYPLPGGTVTVGGRARLALPDTDRRVTVGKRTTCFYRVVGGKAVDFESVKTSDTDAIREQITARPAPAGSEESEVR